MEISLRNQGGRRQAASASGLLARQGMARHAIAPIAVAIAFLLRALLDPILADQSRYLLFVPAVLLTARSLIMMSSYALGSPGYAAGSTDTTLNVCVSSLS